MDPRPGSYLRLTIRRRFVAPIFLPHAEGGIGAERDEPGCHPIGAGHGDVGGISPPPEHAGQLPRPIASQRRRPHRLWREFTDRHQIGLLSRWASGWIGESRRPDLLKTDLFDEVTSGGIVP
jgi:hypothetical protein